MTNKMETDASLNVKYDTADHKKNLSLKMVLNTT